MDHQSNGTKDLRFTFAHNNFNVVSLEKSLAFYQEALGLTVMRRKEADKFTLVFLGDGENSHQLEPEFPECVTWFWV